MMAVVFYIQFHVVLVPSCRLAHFEGFKILAITDLSCFIYQASLCYAPPLYKNKEATCTLTNKVNQNCFYKLQMLQRRLGEFVSFPSMGANICMNGQINIGTVWIKTYNGQYIYFNQYLVINLWRSWRSELCMWYFMVLRNWEKGLLGGNWLLDLNKSTCIKTYIVK